MLNSRPPLTVQRTMDRNGSTRGTTVVTSRPGTFSRNRPSLPPLQLSPTMKLITRSRQINGERPILGFNPMTIINKPHVPPLPHQNPMKDKLKHEHFEDFAARMMKTTNDNELYLGPEIHAALISMANGIDPMIGQERKRQLRLRLQQRLESIKDEKQNGGSTVPPPTDTPGTTSVTDIPGVIEDESPFATTFGGGVGRTTLEDMESFQKRNRMWKSTLKSTYKYFQHSANSSKRGSEHLLQDTGISDVTVTNQYPVDPKPQSLSKGTNAKAKATADLDRVLQRGSALLMASSALKARLKVKKLSGVEKKNKVVVVEEYSPPSTSFLQKAKEGILNLPIYDRFDTKRQNVLEQGFPFDSFEQEINGAIRVAARQMKQKSTNPVLTLSDKPFNGINLSSLVGQNAAKVQGFRQHKVLGPSDTMNPLQLKLVQGLQDSELSSFLENHGRRNREVGMQIIPGRAPERPGVTSTPFQRSTPLKTLLRPYEPSPLEPKFRALPQSVISRFGEDFGSVCKDDVTVPCSKEEYPGGTIPSYRFGKGGTTSSKKPIVLLHGPEAMKKLSFMDVTKSEFIREMRQHQSQFQQIKSKDEMRKSFPKTYIFPKLHKN